jgi:hypothetical protein
LTRVLRVAEFHVVPNVTPIDLGKLRITVFSLLERLVNADYEGICRLAKSSRLSPADLKRVIRDYGRQLVSAPCGAAEFIDIIPISNSQPQRWSVVVP